MVSRDSPGGRLAPRAEEENCQPAVLSRRILKGQSSLDRWEPRSQKEVLALGPLHSWRQDFVVLSHRCPSHHPSVHS